MGVITMFYFIPTIILFALFVENPYTWFLDTPFLDLQRVCVLGLTMHQGLTFKLKQHSKVDKFKRKEYKLWLECLE